MKENVTGCFFSEHSVVKVLGVGGHIEQSFTWLSCCVKFSLFYLDIHASTHFHLYFTIVI